MHAGPSLCVCVGGVTGRRTLCWEKGALLKSLHAGPLLLCYATTFTTPSNPAVNEPRFVPDAGAINHVLTYLFNVLFYLLICIVFRTVRARRG